MQVSLPDPTAPNDGGVPQSHNFFHPHFSNHATVPAMSDTFNIGVRPLTSITKAGYHPAARAMLLLLQNRSALIDLGTGALRFSMRVIAWFSTIDLCCGIISPCLGSPRRFSCGSFLLWRAAI